MKPPRQIASASDLEEILTEAARRPVLVFKHSTTCPISARAYQAWQAFLAAPEAQKVTAVWVRVIEERPLSLGLANRVGVPHQSPQAILLVGGEPVWNESHYAITEEALRSAVSRLA